MLYCNNNYQYDAPRLVRSLPYKLQININAICI